MSEETPTPAEETPAPQVFEFTAGQRADGGKTKTGPVELVYTPDGWVIKE